MNLINQSLDDINSIIAGYIEKYKCQSYVITKEMMVTESQWSEPEGKLQILGISSFGGMMSSPLVWVAWWTDFAGTRWVVIDCSYSPPVVVEDWSLSVNYFTEEEAWDAASPKDLAFCVSTMLKHLDNGELEYMTDATDRIDCGTATLYDIVRALLSSHRGVGMPGLPPLPLNHAKEMIRLICTKYSPYYERHCLRTLGKIVCHGLCEGITWSAIDYFHSLVGLTYSTPRYIVHDALLDAGFVFAAGLLKTVIDMEPEG